MKTRVFLFGKVKSNNNLTSFHNNKSPKVQYWDYKDLVTRLKGNIF